MTDPICYGCEHCGCDPYDPDDSCFECDECFLSRRADEDEEDWL